MSIAYPTKVNKRPVGGEQPISSEQHTIGISGAFTSTPNRIRTIEVPLEEMPSSVIIPGYSEIPFNGPSPVGFQFAVDYSLGRIYFDPARNGNTVFVSYKGRGSEVDSEDINEVDIPVGIALNSNGSLSAGIVHPVNISTVNTDDFLFPRDLTVTRNLIVDNNSSVVGNMSQGGTTLTINTAESGAPTLNAQLTVDRGSSPAVSLRWNESVDAWEFLNSSGSAIVQFFDNNNISYSGNLELQDGTALAPSLTFVADTDTGLYRIGSNELGITLGGVKVLDIAPSTLSIYHDTAELQLVRNTNARRAYMALRDSAGSIEFRSGVNGAGETTNIAHQFTGDAPSTGTVYASIIGNGQFQFVDGTAAIPTLSFLSETNSGLYRSGANTINLSLGGTSVVAFSPTAINSTVKYEAPNGSDLAPSYTFASEPTSGISLPFTKTLLFSIDSIGEVARFTPAGDFQIKEGEKIIMDGTGNAFLRFTSASSMYGQTSNLGGFHFGSNNELVLFANSVVGEPTLSMLTDGTLVVKNSTQGTATDRTFKLEISQQFASGYHRTFQLFPSDALLGTAATGTATVVNYAALTGAILTVGGTSLTEGVQWTASVDNNTTASSLAAAIALSGVATGAAVGNVVNITANTPGVGGNSITLITSDGTNLPVSAPTLLGGADDFVVALGYKANGTTVSAATIDTHGSYPLIVTVNDTEMMQVTSTVIDAKSHNIQNVSDPINDTDAANKRYVNNVAAGLDPKASCTASTTGSNLSVTASGTGVGKTLTATVNGVLTLDGISTWVDMVNDGGVNDPFSTSTKASRVLIKDQTTAKDNGIYAVQQKGDGSHPFILVRATDFDGSPSNEVSGGNFTFVEEGTNLAATGWVVVATGTITVDTDAINWTQFSTGAIPILAADPGSPTTGRIWFNSTDGQFKGYNGSSVVIMG